MNLREVRQHEIQKELQHPIVEKVCSIEQYSVETSFKDTIADLYSQGYRILDDSSLGVFKMPYNASLLREKFVFGIIKKPDSCWQQPYFLDTWKLLNKSLDEHRFRDYTYARVLNIEDVMMVKEIGRQPNLFTEKL